MNFTGHTGTVALTVTAFISASSRKWQDKADLLTKLECQVKRMKEGFDAKEKALQEERDKTAQAHK